MRHIDDLGDVRGKRVLVRSDLNVPLEGTVITDDGRIRASVPTIQKLADAGARVVVTAHLGRPKGAPDPQYSLAPVAARLGELLGQDVAFATDTVGDSAKATVDALEDGQVAVLENVRFNEGETSKDDAERGAFADRLAALADVFVGDGFGVVHRKQASVYDVAAAAAARDGRPGRRGDRRAAPAHRDPRAAVRRGARRVEGLRQARRDRQPARQGRQAADRRRDGVHLPQGPGPRGRQQPARGGQARDLPRVPPPRRGVGGADPAAHRHLVADEFPRDDGTTSPSSPRTRSRPTRSGSTSDPSRARRSPRRSPTRGRCSGTGRWASSSSSRSPAGPAAWPRP